MDGWLLLSGGGVGGGGVGGGGDGVESNKAHIHVERSEPFVYSLLIKLGMYISTGARPTRLHIVYVIRVRRLLLNTTFVRGACGGGGKGELPKIICFGYNYITCNCP